MTGSWSMGEARPERVIVIGAGMAGLVTARLLHDSGCKVTVLERHERAVGASIRNFGMVWPIGVPNGPLYERALRSRRIWQELIDVAGLWHYPSGSMHVAHADDEWAVLQQYAAANAQMRPCRLLDRDAALAKSPALVARELRGALFNTDELVVDPRQAIRALPDVLRERHGVQFQWRTPVTAVESGQGLKVVRCRWSGVCPSSASPIRFVPNTRL
mgnify:CR=1 FL=1